MAGRPTWLALGEVSAEDPQAIEVHQHLQRQWPGLLTIIATERSKLGAQRDLIKATWGLEAALLHKGDDHKVCSQPDGLLGLASALSTCATDMGMHSLYEWHALGAVPNEASAPRLVLRSSLESLSCLCSSTRSIWTLKQCMRRLTVPAGAPRGQRCAGCHGAPDIALSGSRDRVCPNPAAGVSEPAPCRCAAAALT